MIFYMYLVQLPEMSFELSSKGNIEFVAASKGTAGGDGDVGNAGGAV